MISRKIEVNCAVRESEPADMKTNYLQPYWKIHDPLDPPPPDASYLPTQEQIDRVLAPHQTHRERNLSLLIALDLSMPVWIRTCYARDLQDAWEKTLENAAELEEVDDVLLLDDEGLYSGYGEEWAKILLRLPLLPDAVPYTREDPNLDEGEYYGKPPDDERFMPMYEAARRSKQVVYLIDEEALRNNVVKILYLDIHGHAVWHNTIAPESIWEFEANYHRGGALSRAVLEHLDEHLLQPGEQLEYGG